MRTIFINDNFPKFNSGIVCQNPAKNISKNTITKIGRNLKRDKGNIIAKTEKNVENIKMNGEKNFIRKIEKNFSKRNVKTISKIQKNIEKDNENIKKTIETKSKNAQKKREERLKEDLLRLWGVDAKTLIVHAQTAMRDAFQHWSYIMLTRHRKTQIIPHAHGKVCKDLLNFGKRAKLNFFVQTVIKKSMKN